MIRLVNVREAKPDWFRRVVETTQDGVWVVDARAQTLFVNQRMADMLGYRSRELEAKSPLDFMPPGDRKAAAVALRNAATDPRSVMLERQFAHRDGHCVWTLLAADPFFDEAGRYAGSVSIITDVSDRRAHEVTVAHLRQLVETLRSSEQALVNVSDEASFLAEMCRLLTEEGGFPAAWIALTQDGANDPIRVIEAGGAAASKVKEIIGTWRNRWVGPVRQAVETDTIKVVDDVDRLPTRLPWRDVARRAGLQSLLAVPIRTDRAVSGVLVVHERARSAFTPEIVEHLERFARDLSFGLETLRVRIEREQYLDGLEHRIDSLIGAISIMVELRDPYTAGHQRRVSELAGLIAVALGLDDDATRGVVVAARIHDVGKIAVPAEILTRPGELSSDERALIRSHAIAGFEIVKDLDFPWPVADMVRHHHERLDGSGYPDALAGDEISIGSRILAVADTAEAMMSHRPYRPARSKAATIGYLRDGRGHIFDAAVVDACMRVLAKFKTTNRSADAA